MITRPAHAKINLFLRIVRRRPDGYHEIETLFQKIELADILVFEETSKPGLELLCKGAAAADCGSPAENLVTRAYEALRERLGGLPGVRVALTKNIPVGGGLGGGSSDAATTLLALRELFELDLDDRALAEAGAGLGADVPFFLQPGNAAVGRGVGEELEPVRTIRKLWTAMVFPGIPVATGDVYKRYDPEHPPETNGSLSRVLEGLAGGTLADVLDHVHNDLQELTFELSPVLGGLRDQLQVAAGQKVFMSGSGSTLFTVTDSRDEAVAIARCWQIEKELETDVSAFLTDE